MHDHRILNGALAAGSVHVRGDANRVREIGDPKREIHERKSVLEERPSARFGPSEAPTSAAGSELVLSGAYAKEPSELTALQEAIKLLHVAAEAMVVANYDLAA